MGAPWHQLHTATRENGVTVITYRTTFGNLADGGDLAVPEDGLEPDPEEGEAPDGLKAPAREGSAVGFSMGMLGAWRARVDSGAVDRKHRNVLSEGLPSLRAVWAVRRGLG